MGFTDSQLHAINVSGKNVLVSASAGSGKTGVLKERVIEKLKKGVYIDELVVLTFTEAAAAEMKSRIINDIYKLNLSHQIERIDNAIISTFDSFTLRLVKEYHYLLGLDNNIGISDQIIITSRKKGIIKEVLKDYFVNPTADFIKFFKMYFSKSDNWLEESIFSIGESLRKRPDYLKIINNYDNYFLTDIFLEQQVDLYIDSIKKQIEDYYQIFKKIYLDTEIAYDSDYSNYLAQINDLIMNLLKRNGDKFLDGLLTISFPSKPRNKDTDKPKIIDQIKKVKTDFENLFSCDKAELIDSFKDSVFQVKMLLDIVKTYLIKFESIKKEEKLLSFEDIMFYAIRLFEEFDDVREKYKNNVNEILIDEYQDTNDLQDQFISLISNDNLFMVGDVKQSIYRFRNANPKNFMRIYEEFLLSDKGEAIFLQENFRSNRYVLQAINKIFEKVMTIERGGVLYQDKQVLKSGYEDNSLLHQNPGLKKLAYDFKKIKEEYQETEKANVESIIVCKDIVERLNKKEKIYDLKIKSFRELEYKDITVLVAQKSDFNIYLQELGKYNIPVDVYDDKPFFAGDEIRFLFEMLRLIYCFKDDEYLMKNFKASLYGVARSFVYQIKDQEIIAFLVNENISCHKDIETLLNYDSLCLIYEDIVDLIAKNWELPNYVILEELYKKLRIYRSIASLDNPIESENKVDFFLQKVKSLDGFVFKDLIDYLEIIIEDNSFDIEYKESKASLNAIKLMSMHKSKGLQFPLVYLIGLDKQFYNPENRTPFIFSKDFGILTKSYKEGLYPNFMQKMYFSNVESEDLSEKIRLLYVAMTRAVNELVLVINYNEEIDEFKNINSFSVLLHQCLKIEDADLINFEFDDYSLKKTEIESSSESIQRLSFDFETEVLDKVTYSKQISDLLDDETIEFLEKGSEYHRYLEMIDFNNLEDSITDFPEMIKSAIYELVNTEVFRKLSKPKYFKEYEFYEEKEKGELRGIIDLLIIDETDLIVIDYKLRNIDDSHYEKQLRGYYNYLKDKTNKNIKVFLYSLTKALLKEIII